MIKKKFILSQKTINGGVDQVYFYGKILTFARRYWWAGMIIFSLMIVDIFFSIGFAYVNEKAINFIEIQSFDSFAYLLQLTAVIGVIVIALLFLLNFLKSYVPALVSRDLSEEIFLKINTLPLVKLTPYHTGDKVARIKDDPVKAVEVIGNSAYSIVNNVLLATVAFIYLSLISWPLALLTVSVGPITLIAGRYFDKKLRSISYEIQNVEAEIKGFLQEYIQGIRTIRSYDLERTMIQKYKSLKLHYNLLFMRRTTTTQLMMITLRFTNQIVFITVFFIICLLTFNGKLDIGSTIAFFILMNRVQAPFSAISQSWGMIQESYGSSKRIYEILDMVDHQFPLELNDQLDNTLVSLKQIFFRYKEETDESSLVLNNVSLEIKNNELVAIVGRSGSGKSTLAKIISGLYIPSGGKIIAKKNGFEDSSLINHVSYVPQQPYVFSGTVYENIAISNASATREEVIDAAKQAQIHQDILKLDKGYEEFISEKGDNLSGGQLQRLTIARAFLKRSPLLVLDEATSALDPENERLIVKALESYKKEGSVVVITHRLATVENADEIIVLNEGEIFEKGKHVEMVENKGLYFELLTTLNIDKEVEV